MRRLRRTALAALVLALIAAGLAGRAAADGVTSEVDARKVGLQDQIQLTITAEGSSLPDQIALPALTNLRVIGGPSVSTQVSIVNMSMTQSKSWTYVLQPLAVGHAEVGAVSVRLKSGEVSAPAIPIEVVAGASNPQPARQRPYDPLNDDPFRNFLDRGRPAEPQLFVEAKPSRSSLYVGEPLLLTYYLYTQTSVSGLQFANAPEYTGFWAEDLAQKGQPEDEPVGVNGVRYHRFAVMRKVLFPTRAGHLTIPAATLAIQVPPQGFFDTGGTLQRNTKSITVDVKPIPEESGFSGAVGTFQATSTVDRSSLAFGEAATLRFEVEGEGNLKWIDHGPDLAVPGAKVYPPTVKSNLEVKPNGIVGSRTWEYVVVPQTTGALEIPSLTFSYFDPATRAVVRKSTPPLPLRVEGGAAGAPVPAPVVGGGGAARAGALPLRADLDLPSRWSASIPGRWVGFVALGALLGHGLLLGSGAFARIGRGGAGRVAASASVRGALGELRRVGQGGMSKEAAAGLIEKTIHKIFGSLDGDESERARAVRGLLEEVHAVRYAPQLGDYSERLRELASRAGEMVRRWA